MSTKELVCDIYLAYTRVSHHSDHSGYDQLNRYLGDSARLITPDLAGNVLRTLAFMMRGVTGMQWYAGDSLNKELHVLKKCLRHEKAIYHFLYGEDNFRYAGLARRISKNARIMTTYHQPPGVFDRVVGNKKHLNMLDAIVAISTNQVSYFESLAGKGKVSFVPHGIDVEYFHPGYIKGKNNTEKNCLFVGQWLRDFDCLRSVIEIITDREDHVRFDIVTTRKFKDVLAGMKKVRIQTNIPDRRLRLSYLEADVIVLPLLDCTANNCILEAMACGVPIVTTDIGGVRDYVDKENAVLVPLGDSGTMAEKVLMLLEDDELRLRMGKAGREKAVREFAWGIVARRMLETYERVAER